MRRSSGRNNGRSQPSKRGRTLVVGSRRPRTTTSTASLSGDAAAQVRQASSALDEFVDFGPVSMLRCLPIRDRPGPSEKSLIPIIGNFYILAKEVLDYMNKIDGLFIRDREYINLRVVRAIIEDDFMVGGSEDFEVFTQEPRDSVEFLRNEYKKMCSRRRYRHFATWMFAHVEGAHGDRLVIPTQDVFDLPLYIMLYILKMLITVIDRRENVFHVLYSLGTPGDDIEYPIIRDNGSVVTVVNDMIKVRDLEYIYMTIIRRFASLLPGIGQEGSWQGSEDSGTRIMLRDMVTHSTLVLRLILRPAHSTTFAHKWTQQVEDLLRETAGSCVLTVRNREDNMCLLYCVIMGLLVKCKDHGSRIFGTSDFVVEPSTIYSKGMYSDPTATDDISVLIRRLSRFLMYPLYSEGDVDDPLLPILKEIDSSVGTMLSMSEFRERFALVEKRLIPDGNCGIDVYGIDFNINQHIYPLYVSKQRDKVIELLCVTPLQTRCSHFALITRMDKLMQGTGGKQFFSCTRCGECFYHRRLLSEHKCPSLSSHITVPGDGGFHFSEKNADPSSTPVFGSCAKCRLCFADEFRTEYHKMHCLMQGQTGYRHVQLISYDVHESPVLTGEEVDMEKEEKHVKQRRVLYADFESYITPKTGEHNFMSYGIYDWEDEEYKCGYNLQEFLDFVLDKAYSGEQEQIYVYFHNAMGYDANFILRHVLRHPEYSNWGIQVIMKSTNKLQKLVFYTRRDGKTRKVHIGDTFLFLTLSLERIVDSIRKDSLETNEENFSCFFQTFRKRYPWVSDESINHILRKNIFPYRFFSDAEKLDVPISEFRKIFEPREENRQFFSERVTVEDLAAGYEDTQHVMDTFRCSNARDYHDLYLCCDVMQLADVFDRSMKILWDSHHIHLTRYLGMPSASWAAFLRHDPTMRIPLYEDTFFAEFFKGMIRGGVTSAALRHAVADERHSIIYLDVNGLYPYVMQAYDFPCGKFEMVPLGWGEEMAKVKLAEYFRLFEAEHKGMCFCVDLHFPPEVKELTDMYPFAPEHRRIYREYFSDFDNKELTPFLQKWSKANNGETMSEFTGLVCTLYDKFNYNIHWRLLRFYMEHGVVVKKVWFGVLFSEGDYLAGYIRKNIAIRNTRKDELGKTLYKLLGNSIYGKTYESPFKRNTFEIVRDPIKMQGLLEEGNIAALQPIDDLGWIVRMDGEDIVLDKPTYIGACVCEFAKLHMYTLLYDKLMRIFPDVPGDPEHGCQMVYTDTDSFIVKVRLPPGIPNTPKALFDYIREQDPDLIGGIGGQVKSETGEDDTIQEVIALRSKVYAYKTIHGHIGKRAKGTTHDAQEMQLDWDTYKKALETLVSVDTRNTQFVRKVFKIASVEVFRQSLSVHDGKREICEDGIHTHDFGYH